MDYNKVNAVASCVIAFTTFLGVWAAIVYYLDQIRESGLLEGVGFGMIYIEINLLFLLYLKLKGVI